LVGIRNLIGLVGDAVSNVQGQFALLLASSPFKKFLTSMDSTLPSIVNKLGTAFVQAFGGLTGVFRALLPFGDKLADSLLRISRNFNEWANSARGQTAITKFMTTAFEDATKLVDILHEIGTSIKLVFQAGEPTGAGFLDSILSSFERLNAFLVSGKGQAAMKRWFDDSKKFITALGGLVGELGKTFDALDTEQGRSNIDGFINGLKGVVTVIKAVLVGTAKLGGAFIQLGKDLDLSGVLSTLQSFLVGVGKAFGALADILKPLFTFISDHSDVFRDLAIGIGAVFGALKGYAIIRTAAAALTAFATGALVNVAARAEAAGASLLTFGRRIGGLSGAAIAGAGNTLTRLGNGFLTFGTVVQRGMGIAVGAIAAAGIGTLIGNMTQNASGLEQTLGAIGSTLTGAFIGLKTGGPIGAAIGGGIGLLTSLKDKLFGASEAEKQFKSNVEGVTSALDANNGVIDKNIEKLIAQTLQQNGTLDAARRQGISTSLVIRATEGNTAAQAELTRQLNEHRTALDRVSDSQAKNIKGGQQFQNQNNDTAASQAEVNKHLDEGKKDLDNIHNAYNTLSDAEKKVIKDHRSEQRALDQLHRENKAALAQLKENRDGTINFSSAIKALDTSFTNLGPKIKGNSSAARDNRAAVLKALQAAEQHAATLRRQGFSADDATAAMKNDIQALIHTATEAGISRKAIQQLIDKLLGVPSDVHSNVKVDGVDESITSVSQLTNALETLRGQTFTYFVKGVFGAVTTTQDTTHPGKQGGRLGGWLPDNGMFLVGESGPEVGIRFPDGRIGILSNRDARKFAADQTGTTPMDRTGLRSAINSMSTPPEPRVAQTININVYPQTADPRAAAKQILNHAVALARI